MENNEKINNYSDNYSDLFTQINEKNNIIKNIDVI